MDGGTLSHGKYSGKLIETIARDDPSYLEWIMDLEDTSVSERRILAASLKLLR